MRKTVTIEGQECTLATIKAGALEEIELAGKTGRAFNIAFIAASIRSAGDTERGKEAWVRDQEAFSSTGGTAPFIELMHAANEVNGIKMAPPGESEPAAPAQ